MNKAYFDVCDSGNIVGSGKKMQCLPKEIIGYVVAKDTVKFSTVSALKEKARWDVFNASKSIWISPFITGELEQSPEDNFTQSKFGDYRGALPQNRVVASHKVNPKQAESVKSIEGSFSTVFFITEAKEIICQVNNDGSVQGLPLYSLLVGNYALPSGESGATIKVNFQFKDYVQSAYKANFDISDYEGVYDLDVIVKSVSASEITFEAYSYGVSFSSLSQSDLKLTKTDGTAQAISGLSYANGAYTLSGNSLASGYLESSGVIDKSGTLVEVRKTAFSI